tara:strand:+ start:2338 stop:3021 length:684 start_codon:yes stop_codon:yes gene_type:complete
MYTQNKKKFYIVGSNPNDFFDMTIEGVETLLKSEIIIFSKTFHRGFRSFLKDNNKNFIFKEDISDREEIEFCESIFNLLKKNNSIAYLISGDPHFNYKNYFEDFFSKRKIDVIKIIGILEIATWVNEKNEFLTNREKNSSIFFYFPDTIYEIKKILDDSISGKLVLIFKEKKLLEKLLKQFNKKSKIKYKLYINGHRKDLKKLPLKLERQFSNAYVILNCEQIQRYI